MGAVVPAVHGWVETNLPPLETLIVGISALGSGWFVALAFAALGLLALLARPARPRLPARAGHAVLPDGVGAEVLHLGRGDQPAGPGAARSSTSTGSASTTSPTSRPAMRCARPSSTASPPSASRASRTTTAQGDDRLCRRGDRRSAPSARRASTSARTTRSTCWAAGWPAARCWPSSSRSTSFASTSAATRGSRAAAPRDADRRVAVPPRQPASPRSTTPTPAEG